MQEAISRTFRTERRLQPGIFPIRDLPGLRCPGAMFGTMAMYCKDNEWNFGEKEIRRLGLAILARACRDAAGRDQDLSTDAREWLSNGEAMYWVDALGLRIKKNDLDQFISSGCKIPKRSKIA